jgi:lipopolysaccharide biosynthesis protein
MSKNAAVIAHFDANDRLDNNFKLVLLCIEQVFDVVVLVTTSDLSETETAQFKKVITIKRPNIGYDFYSYRVGLSYIHEHIEVDNILLVNSSFVVVDTGTFTRMLGDLLSLSRERDVVGITESQQINWHLQSYLLLLGDKIHRSQWLRTFFENVQPLNSKLEVIINYEIGLSRALLANDVETLTLFKPNARQQLLADIRWMRVIIRASGWHCWLIGKPLRHRHEVNWTHFGAEEIARQFGFVKTEILRTNPHGVSTDFVARLSSPAVWASIQTLLGNSRCHYKAGQNGLTMLTSNHPPISTSHMATYGKARVKGVRVAVVVHLFYYDLLDEICSYLNGIVEPYDLYVTTPFEGDVHKIINRTSSIAESVTVWLIENRGRDIGPFISLFRSGLLDGYLAVLKLHSKKSKYSSLGGEWRKQLFGRVIGDSLTIRRTLQLFEEGDVGIVGPHQFYLSHDSFWGANYENVKRLLILTGHLEPDHEPKLGFFAGSMFWFTPKAIRYLKKIPEEILDFEPECGKQDGTLAHAIERVFCSVVKTAGYKVTSVSLAGVDISETDTQGNRVPVL